MPEPTAKQIIAFYQWQKQGSYVKAAEVLGVSKQAVHARVYRLKMTNPEFFNRNIDRVAKKFKPKILSYRPEIADSQVVKKF